MAHRTAIIRTSDVTFAGWSWSAVLAGLFASLVVQILLTMLGFGVGLLSVDMNIADEAPKLAGWVAFAWWAVSGIIAAFIGGAVAAANAPDQSDAGRTGHALAAWAVAVVVVTGASALTAGSAAGVATNLAGPSYEAITRLDRYRVPAATTGQAAVTAERPTPAQVEEARRHFAYVMLASFCALILGAFAAYGAGMATTPRVSRQVTDAVT
jgi:hypothetical protein